ncbi:MAG TPA: hypothetical protein VD866_01280 [Urbifossiella sp.]|nr:hypothetical protein [Urbifossiella sp.]
MATAKIVFKIGEIDKATMEKIEGWLRQHHGRGGWRIKRVTVDEAEITVHYFDEIAKLAFEISPELNEKPAVKQLSVPRPAASAG